MKPEEMETFCRAAQMGVALGMEHRYEWYTCASRSLIHGYYPDMPLHQAKLDAAFLAFEKGTASCPYEEEELSTLSMEELYDRINSWYASASVRNAPQS